MAQLILKSPYIKGGKDAGGHARYIATRERVELVPDGRPATQKQAQLIASLTKDFPDAKKLPEYSSYRDAPTKANASAFITRTLEDNWPDVQQRDIYAEYIATRPRVERVGSHGLFGDEDYVDLKKVTSELQTCEKNVWTHIISLKREDAARLGYDNARTWRNLLLAHRNDIAAAMNIPPNEFRWYAAFHDEGDHPHVHMMAWSAGDAPGYLSPVGIEKIKSMLTNDIFRQEMLHVYEQKSSSRDDLVRKARAEMKNLVQEMRQAIGSHSEVESLMMVLASQPESITGKKKYGYLPKAVKKTVDEMKGTIEMDSEIDKGSVFRITLPMQVDEAWSTDPAAEERNVRSNIAGMRVLLVEDNELNREILEFILEDADAEVVTANDGKAAVDAFAASEPGTFDCVLMDLMMPVMSGYEATREIRSLGRSDAEDVPIIALSANAFEEDVAMAKDAGMNEHLSKPVDIKKMFRAMSRLRRYANENK